MFEATVSGDWHFTKLARFFPFGNDIPIQLAEIEKIFIFSVEAGIRHLVVPGDITHKPNLPDEYMTALLKLLNRYKTMVHVHYIPGNHDFKENGKGSTDVLDVMAKCEMLPNFTVYKKVTDVVIDGTRVVFVPYPYKEYPEGDPALVFAHVEQVGAMGDNGLPLRKVSGNHTVKLHRGDVLVSGHLHTHQFLKTKRTLFPGAPYQTTFGEQGPKGFITIKAKAGEDRLRYKWEFINSNPAFTLINVRIDSDADWEKLEKDRMVLYKITKAPGITTPANLTKDYPNIMSISGEFDAEAHAMVLEAKLSSLTTITPLTGLKAFLRNTTLSAQDRKAAYEEAKLIANEVSS